MPEMDAFERRLSNALVAYAHEMPSRVDAVAVAGRVAAERPHRAWHPALPVMPRLAWVIVAAVLLALAVGLVAVGSGLIERLRLFPARNHGITVVAPTAWGGSQAVASFDGDVWILEQSGLARLDPAGRTIRTWDASDDLAFMASGIAPARGGGVWLLTSQTVRRFDGERLGEPLRLPAEAKTVIAAAEAPDGSVWAATEGGLYRRRDGSWTVVPGQREGVSAAAIVFDSRGDAWVPGLEYPGPTAQGLARYDGSTWTTFTTDAAGTPLPEVTSLAPDSSGGIWAGTMQGLLHLDGSTWTNVAAGDLGAAGTWTPVVGKAGDVWAVTAYTDGPVHVARLSGGVWTRWGPEAGLPGPDATGASVGSIAVTQAGPFVSVPSAAYRLVGDRWEQEWKDPAGEPLLVRALVPAAGVEAWGLTGGSSDGRLTPQLWHRAPGGVSLEPLPDGATQVNGLALARDGTPWMATDAGVAVRSDERWTIVDPRPAVGITIAPDGTAWAMGSDSSLRTVRRGNAGWEGGDVPGSASTGGSVRATWGFGPVLAIDGSGHPWTDGGLFAYSHAPGLRRFDGQRWEPMLPNGTTSQTVFEYVAAGPDGSVWVTIDGTGSTSGCCTPAEPATQVARFDGSRWTVWGTADGLPADNSGRSLAITTDGTAWLSTTAGLYRFDGRTWRLALGDHSFYTIVAAPDGALWTTGGPMLRIADPPR
jgi:hypothetical protein